MAEPTGTQAGPREADLILGRKLLMEYDYGSNAWKLVVDADLNIGDFEIGAVEIKDGVADYRAWVDSNSLLHVYDHASSGTMVVNIEGDYPEDSPMTNEDLGLYVLSVREDDMVSNVDTEGDFASFQTDQFGRLWTFTTGSYMKAQMQAWNTGTSQYDDLLVDENDYLVVTLGTALQHTDDSVEAWLLTGSYIGVQGWNEDATEWQNLLVDANQYLMVTLGTRLDETQDEVTAYVTGTVNVRGYYPGGGTYEDLIVDANQYLMVTLGTRLDETQDEVTAYITGAIAGTFAEDAPHTSGDLGLLLLGVREDDLQGNVNAEGDYSALQTDQYGRLWAFLTGSYVDARARLQAWNTGTADWANLQTDENDYLVVTLGTQLTAGQDSISAVLPTGTSVILDFHENVQRAPIDITGSGAAQYTIVTGAGGVEIRVMEVFMTTSNGVTARYRDGAVGAWLTGPIRLPNDGDGFYVGSPDGRDLFHFGTSPGQDLILDLNAGCQMGGWILWYYK